MLRKFWLLYLSATIVVMLGAYVVSDNFGVEGKLASLSEMEQLAGGPYGNYQCTPTLGCEEYDCGEKEGADHYFAQRSAAGYEECDPAPGNYCLRPAASNVPRCYIYNYHGDCNSTPTMDTWYDDDCFDN